MAAAAKKTTLPTCSDFFRMLPSSSAFHAPYDKAMKEQRPSFQLLKRHFIFTDDSVDYAHLQKFRKCIAKLPEKDHEAAKLFTEGAYKSAEAWKRKVKYTNYESC